MTKLQPVDTCYVGIPLPDEVLNHIKKWQARLNSMTDDIKWEKRANLYIPLAYVGKLSTGERSTVLEGMRSLEVRGTPITLSVGNIDYFYNRHGESLLWLAVYDTEHVLVNLHKQLVKYLNGRGFSLSERKLVPHIVIGRVVKIHGEEKKKLLAKLAEVEVDKYLQFELEELQLLKSSYQKLDNSNNYTVLNRLGLVGGVEEE